MKAKVNYCGKCWRSLLYDQQKSNTKHADTAIAAIRQTPVQIIEPALKLFLEAAAIKAKHCDWRGEIFKDLKD